MLRLKSLGGLHIVHQFSSSLRKTAASGPSLPLKSCHGSFVRYKSDDIKGAAKGIGLDTTNSRVKVIENSEGSRTTPSVVAFAKGTEEYSQQEETKKERVEAVNPAEGIINDTETENIEYESQLSQDEIKASLEDIIKWRKLHFSDRRKVEILKKIIHRLQQHIKEPGSQSDALNLICVKLFKIGADRIHGALEQLDDMAKT